MSGAPDLYAGVDAGATKTLAVVVDAEGRERGRAAAGGANPAAVGIERAHVQVRAAVKGALQAAGAEGALAAAWFGLAGFDRPEDREAWLPRLTPLAGALRLTNDGELALTGLESAVGVGVICGTGSIAFGRDAHGNGTRAGGWGHIVGDEGSGWELGRRALQAAARAHDGRGPATSLLPAIIAWWDLSAPEQLIGRVYPDVDKALIAGLAPLVLAAAREGDAVARGIVEDATEEIALLTLAVAERLELPEALPLALAGGLVANEEGFREEVLRRISEVRPLGQVAVVRDAPLSAARAARELVAGEREA